VQDLGCWAYLPIESGRPAASWTMSPPSMLWIANPTRLRSGGLRIWGIFVQNEHSGCRGACMLWISNMNGSSIGDVCVAVRKLFEASGCGGYHDWIHQNVAHAAQIEKRIYKCTCAYTSTKIQRPFGTDGEISIYITQNLSPLISCLPLLTHHSSIQNTAPLGNLHEMIRWGEAVLGKRKPVDCHIPSLVKGFFRKLVPHSGGFPSLKPRKFPTGDFRTIFLFPMSLFTFEKNRRCIL
jgi:hypothetical protein